MNESFSFFNLGVISDLETLQSIVVSFSEEEWLKYAARKRRGGIAAENTDTIPLLYNLNQNSSEPIEHEYFHIFKSFIDQVALLSEQNNFGSDVQQAMVTRLKSRTSIGRHMDKGPMTAKNHRIHVPIFTNKECIFTVGDESLSLESGDIWIIDNVGKYHSVANMGATDRVHLIIDIH